MLSFPSISYWALHALTYGGKYEGPIWPKITFLKSENVAVRAGINLFWNLRVSEAKKNWLDAQISQSKRCQKIKKNGDGRAGDLVEKWNGIFKIHSIASTAHGSRLPSRSSYPNLFRWNTIHNLKNRMYNLKNKTRVYNIKTLFFKLLGS